MLIALGLLLLVGPPLVCCALLARTRTAGVAVTAVLLVAAGLLGCVWTGLIEVRGAADLTLGYPLAAALLLTLTERAQTRRLGPRPRPMSRAADNTVVVLLAVQLSAVVLAIPLYLLFLSIDTEEGGAPRSDVARPLPPGLGLVSNQRGCASGGCWRELTVASDDGRRAGEVVALLQASGAQTCRRNGWLLDDRDACVEIHPTSGDEVRLLISFR